MVVAVIDKRPQFCIDRRGSENNNKKENSIPADKQKHDNKITGMFPSCVCVCVSLWVGTAGDCEVNEFERGQSCGKFGFDSSKLKNKI